MKTTFDSSAISHTMNNENRGDRKDDSTSVKKDAAIIRVTSEYRARNGARCGARDGAKDGARGGVRDGARCGLRDGERETERDVE